MGKIKWTKAQEQVIEKRNANILVSAAAGSGKTAVLVERIFKRILDEENPVNVDQFVVVTFTKAAAAQMKERLRSRLEKELELQPDNAHLQRQIGLISHAHISTVHSFCGYVLQNYFHRIGLDPSYRQGTDSELKMLKKEVLEDLLEQEYTKKEADFVEFAGMSQFNKDDVPMEEMILDVYHRASSEPFPLQWLEDVDKIMDIKDDKEWEQSVYVQHLLDRKNQIASTILQEVPKVLEVCQSQGGPYYFQVQVKQAQEIAEEVMGKTSFGELYEYLQDVRFKDMRGKKDENVEQYKINFVTAYRDNWKTMVVEFRKQFFMLDSREYLQELKGMSGKVRTLIRLTKEFHHMFGDKKRERNVVDFNDLEHLALEILLKWDEEKGEYVRTEAALELAGYFEEIMIDEYQDSNRVQDTLLKSISKEGLPKCAPNIFMVGDVKQSIYRFRNACPEMFAEKLDSYGREEMYCRIDLDKNFRSRSAVLEGTNAIFTWLMHRDIGGVEYDEAASLKVGLKFEREDEDKKKIEVWRIANGQDMEAEGRLVASRIKEMMNPKQPMYIEEDGISRPIQYRDIAILSTSVKNDRQNFYDVLTEAGIPVVMEHTQGFYETREIQWMTSMLEVLDNPNQDYPLATILLGPMFHFSEEEMVHIRGKSKDKSLYESLWAYGKADEIYEKIQRFLGVLDKLRSKISYATVADLIQDIYDETGIYDTIRMMKESEQRIANMDTLMEQARQFDRTSYHGLYQFVRYINRIKEQKEEVGEASIVGEEEDVVRFMTIHKSKGLEFPVCFVIGMGKQLIQKSGSEPEFLFHPQLGIAGNIIDVEKGTRKKSIFHEMIKEKNREEDLGEKMRLLYVALTRGKEKLILVGCLPENTKIKAAYEAKREKLNRFFDMVLPIASCHDVFQCETIEMEELLQEEAKDILEESVNEDVLNNFDTSVIYHEEVHKMLEDMDVVEVEKEPLPVKVSVSELKVKSMEEQGMEDFTIFSHEEENIEMPIPSFIQEKVEDNAHQGAAYGTIWHQVMATIDFEKTSTLQELKEGVQTLLSEGKLCKGEEDVLNYKKMQQFFASTLGQEMIMAQKEGRLYREQPFVMEKPACEIYEDCTQKSPILIQGIMDAFYETEKGIVLMDYKTDSLKAGQEQVLVQRYEKQMQLYKEALEYMLEKPVVASVLYSFSLGKEIYL